MFLDIKLNWQKIILGLLMIGIFGLGFLITYLSLKMSKIFVKPGTPTPNTFADASPKPLDETQQKKGIYNVVFLGYGGAGHDGSLLTDSIIIIHVDTTIKKAALISVPRDLWYTGNHKINAEGSINGFNNVGVAIKNVTGLPINYFVSVDFGGFIKIIDDLGGITVNVPVTFDDPFYPIAGQENNTCGFTEDQVNVLKTKYSGYNLETQFTCRYEHLHFDKGPADLNGTTALKFVRSRHGDSDFGRSLRQFAVLQGIESKLISFQASNKFNDIVNTISQIVRTDLDAGTIKSLISVFGDPKAYNIKQVQLTIDNVLGESKSSDGAYILIPKTGNLNFSGIRDYIKSNLD
jgi:anionic cell wall polymer biosynthesis LytR-Cps2A-Psr (LCP) family protein